jgi:predicted HicB family RNase H-like nuclease
MISDKEKYERYGLIALRMQKQTADTLRELAREDRRSVNSYVVKVLEEYIDRVRKDRQDDEMPA